MSRRRIPKARLLTPDPVYGSSLIHQIVNNIMKNGKKSLAYRLMYACIKNIGEKTEQDPIKVVEEAVINATPLVVVKAKRIGGSSIQIPVPISADRGKALGIRWIIASCKSRPGKEMVSKLTTEFIEASKKQGNAVRKKQETQKMAEANKSFSRS